MHGIDRVNDAIRRRLYIQEGKAVLGGPGYWRVYGIDGGNVKLVYGDGGQEDRPCDCQTKTLEEFDAIPLYRSVGIWSFARDDDPAADYIAMAERDPHAAGNLIYDLKVRLGEA